MKKYLIVLLILLFNSQAFAVTYYMADTVSSGNPGWGNGSNSYNTTQAQNKATPWLTMVYAASQMSAGDILIIDDGDYDTNSCLDTDTDTIPEGSIGAGYTTFQAENDGLVTVDGGGTDTTLKIWGDDTIDGLTGPAASHDYLMFRGIVYTNSSTYGIYTAYVNHIKVINCGISETPNAYSVRVYTTTDSLFEGCYAWGVSLRYVFVTYQSTQTIFRNCVARIDRSIDTGNALGAFVAYRSGLIDFQNCINIDSDQQEYYDLTPGVTNIAGSFGVPTTDDTTLKDTITFTNCIALNNQIRFGSYDDGAYASDAVIVNSVGWGIRTFNENDMIHSQGGSTFTGCNFGDIDTLSGGAVTFSWYNAWPGGNTTSSEDNMYYNLLSGGLNYLIGTSDNNNIYGLGGDIDVNTTVSTNTKTYDPTSNGLLYIVRTETSSQLKTDLIGANIKYQHGASGTLWGESGYNLIQDGTAGQATVQLWPFPGEDAIKTSMAAYSWDDGGGGAPEIEGARGFAATTANPRTPTGVTTLTSYILEYLGGTIMTVEVYGEQIPEASTITGTGPTTGIQATGPLTIFN